MFFFRKDHLKEMKYISDQKGIINRYLREFDEWQSHLENCKNFILNSAESKNKNSIAVLGSGWLLDFPIKEINLIFKKIYLIDIVHPKQIQNKVKKMKSVELITMDLTGNAVKNVFNFLKKTKKNHKKTFFNDIELENLNFLKDIDFVVSLNILNQLDILIIDHLKKLNFPYEKEILEIRKKIQKHHLENLPKNKSCLITDFEELIFDSKNKLEKTNKLVFIDFKNKKKTWKWDFDKFNYYKNKKVIFNVLAAEI